MTTSEAEALHLLKSAHGQVKALQSMVDDHLSGETTTSSSRRLRLDLAGHRIEGARKRVSHLSGFERQDAVLELRTAVAAARKLLAAGSAEARPASANVNVNAALRAQLYRPGRSETTSRDRTDRRWW